MVPDNWVQSPVATAFRTVCKVGSFAVAVSTCLGSKAAVTAALATLYAKSSVSRVSSSRVELTGRRLRTSAALSLPGVYQHVLELP